MNKGIRYRDEAIGEIRPVPDFLPSPEELALKHEQTKVTIILRPQWVAFFKGAAKKHHTRYPKMIRQLLENRLLDRQAQTSKFNGHLNLRRRGIRD
ncbi:MAG: hypothetical protein L0Y39_12745 [Methylococcaceae bacterium]|nr:hypothetical protein [Methylococcaceae bacterium]